MKYLMNIEGGNVLLLKYLNSLLLRKDLPEDYYFLYVALVPKIPQEGGGKQIRPIYMLEILNKIICNLLFRRAIPYFPRQSG